VRDTSIFSKTGHKVTRAFL